MKFLINTLLFTDDKNIKLPDGFDITLFSDKLPVVNTTADIGCLFGTIQDVYNVARGGGDIRFNFSSLDVSFWLDPLGADFLNKELSYFMLPSQLSQFDVGNFIRSNSGKKVLAGQLLDSTLLSQIQQKAHPYIVPDDMLFLAPPITNILQEFRLWVLDDEIVAISRYDTGTMDTVDTALVKEYAQSVIARYSPDIAYVMDIAVLYERNAPFSYKVIEYNGFSTSGFYNVDLSELLTKVTSFYEDYKGEDNVRQ